jgi:universal stress protein A
MALFNTILHATDCLQRSDSAFQLACSLANDYHAHLVLLHVIPRPAIMLHLEEQQQQLALAKLWNLPVPDNLDAPGRRLEEGNPATEILHVAQIVHADLIVLGTRDCGRLGRFLGVSVAEKVMRQADCPVLTVRTATERIRSFEMDRAAAVP